MNAFFGIFYTFFGWILQFCYMLVHNLPLALILMTVVAKILMLPLGLSQEKNSYKLRRLKPEMDKLKAKYGSDQQKYGVELQKLYEKENYSPTSGCLPLLLQFPIIIGLFGVIYQPLTYILGLSADKIKEIAVAIQASEGFSGLSQGARDQIAKLVTDGAASSRGAEIAVANNLGLAGSVADGIERIDFNLFGIFDLSQTPSIGTLNVLWLIPIFAGLSSMFTSYVSTKMSGTEMNGMTKGMIFGMPLMSVFFAFTLPATIGFYWIVNSLISALQSVLLKKCYNPEKELARVEAKKHRVREKERQEKLDRLRRIHGDDDDDFGIPETAPKAPVAKPENGEEKVLTKNEQKKIAKERLAASRRLTEKADNSEGSDKK